METKEKQLRELLGDDFKYTSLDLIQKSKVKDQYCDVGDIISMNEHFIYDMFRILEKPMEIEGFGGGYIDGWEIPFEDYEMRLMRWGFPLKDYDEVFDNIEKQISEILGLKIFKTDDYL